MTGKPRTAPKATEDMTCEFCHAFHVKAGTAIGGFRSHELSCEKNPNRKQSREDDRTKEWPARIAKGERIPIEEMSPMKANQEKLRVYLETLNEMGGIVEGHQGGGGKDRRSATSYIQERMEERFAKNTANTWQLLRDGGWVDAPVHGRFVPIVRLIGELPWVTETAPTPPVPTPLVPTPTPTRTTETAGSPADTSVDVEPTSAPDDSLPLSPVVGDDEADDLGGRPGRLAARLLREIPDVITDVITSVLEAQREREYAAQGYYPTLPQSEIDELNHIVEIASGQQARMQTRIEDLQQELLILGYEYDHLAEQADQQFMRTNAGTPASKHSLSVAKVRDPFKGLARRALEQGWTIKPTRGSGHLLWRSPEGKVVFSGSTSSDTNAHYIMRRKLRNAGLVIEGGTIHTADFDRFAVGYTNTSSNNER